NNLMVSETSLVSKNVLNVDVAGGETKGFCVKFWYVVDGTSSAVIAISRESVEDNDFGEFYQRMTFTPGPDWVYEQFYVPEIKKLGKLVIRELMYEKNQGKIV